MAKPIPRQRKHKARARTNHNRLEADSNATEVLPQSKVEQDERRQRVRAELQAQQPPSKSLSKKRQRLDKYIDTKLKKEENLELIKNLSESTVDTGLFRSSKKLGRVRDTEKEALSQALKERRAGIGSVEDGDVLFEERRYMESSDDSASQQSDGDALTAPIPPQAVLLTPRPAYSTGTGLKRPLDMDEEGKPVIPQRKRLKTAKKRYVEVRSSGDSDWEGFSSCSEAPGAESALQAQLDTEEDDDSSSEDDSGISSDDTEVLDDSRESSDEDQGSDESNSKEAAKERYTMFKAWATRQRNEAIGFVPSVGTDSFAEDVNEKPQRQHREPAWKPGVTLVRDIHSTSAVNPTAFSVTIERPEEINASRLELPVVAKEQEIMEAISTHGCVIVTGATGSGKTTQVPQFLFEAGYGHPDGPTPGMIGVTQPRRVAAVSMAKRVAFELGIHGDKVSHQVRYDSSVGTKTTLKFMTDGVLLREVSQDFTLSKYSVVVIDEAHERSVNTDILIGMLSRIVETRAQLAAKSSIHRPLKLVIMSATLRVDDFTMNKILFRGETPPVIEAEGKSHEVTVHFSRKTQRDYVEDVYQKVNRGHRKLPPGGILVFLTGQNEIELIGQRLKDAFETTPEKTSTHHRMHVSGAQASIEAEDVDLGRDMNEDGSDAENSYHRRIQHLANDDDADFDVEPEEGRILQKVHVLPLYSQLPSEQQTRVFEQPPEGSRMIVLSTNVAETSLTIPGIRYVFDCGRAKEKSYEPMTGVQSFNIDWISKSSAEQRRGRAGRTGPGHCYRLYSSAVFENHFADHALPEIQRTPVEGVVLQLKSMGIPKVAHFPFPTPPDRSSLLKAERLLEYLQALSDGKVTTIGKSLAYYPLSPRLSRILVAASARDCISHAVAMVALLAVSDIFTPERQMDLAEPVSSLEDGTASRLDTREATLRQQRRKDFSTFHGHAARNDRHSDAIKLLTTLIDFSSDSISISIRKHTRVKALQEALQLRVQLTRIVKTHQSASEGMARLTSSSVLTAPSPAQVKMLRYLIAAGYIDQVAQRADLSPTPPVHSRKPARVTDAPYITLFASHEDDGQKRGQDVDEAGKERASHVFIHPSSVLAHIPVVLLPQYLIYSHLSRAPAATVTSNSTVPLPRTRMHPLTPLSAEHILQLSKGTPLLAEGKPVGRIEMLPRSSEGHERRQCWTVPLLKGDVGGREWPLLPARKVVQKRLKDRGWVLDEAPVI